MKLKYTKPQILFEVIGLIILISLFVIIGIKYSSMPEKIPIHFNAHGEIDNWGSKSTLWMTFIMCIFIYILTTVVSFFPSIWNVPTSRFTSNNVTPLYQCLKTFLIVTKDEILAMFFYITIYMLQGKAMPSMICYIIFGVLILTGIIFFLIGRNIVKKYV